MPNRPGLSLRFGDVRIPATFRGTARLLDDTETPTPPGLTRHDDLHGAFHAELDISFDLLVGLGFRPVDPSHPAYPLYLAAVSASHEPAPASSEPVPGIDPHSPNAVVLPFETTLAITEAMALQYGLVAPGRATAGHRSNAPPPQPRRRPAPPPHPARAGSGAAPPPPIGDFGAFLDFLGDPGRDEAGDAAGVNPVAATGRRVGSDRPSGTKPAETISGAASTTPATGMPALMLPSLAAAVPPPAVPSAAGVASPAVGTAAATGPGAAAEGLAAAGAEVLSSGALWLAPAAVLLAPSSTAANDTLAARGIPIGPSLRGTRVDVGDLGEDLNLSANAFTPVPSPASGSPPLVPPESGPMQESLPIATVTGWRESLTPPAPLPPLPGFGTTDTSGPTKLEGFTPSGGDVPIILEARQPLGPDVVRVNGRYPVNAGYAGQNYPATKLPPALQALYPNGIDFTPQGFPNLRPYAIFETKLSGLTGKRAKDDRRANNAVGLKSTPEGYSWHHVEDGVTMQLVPSDIHKSIKHTGGFAVDKGRKNGS